MSHISPVPPGSNDLATLAGLKALAVDALPTDDMDYGSDRQLTAENLFFERCNALYPSDFEEGGSFHIFCLKATPEEMIGEAIKILAGHLGGDDSLPV